MKTLRIIMLIALLAPIQAVADNFPFEIRRDAAGKLESIVLPDRLAAQVKDADLLKEMEQAYIEYNAPKAMDLRDYGIIPPDEETEEMLNASEKSLATDFTLDSFKDRKVAEEFEKAKEKISKSGWYRLIAAPYSPGAFDEELLLTKLIQTIIDGADSVLMGGTPMALFEFLVDEYFEALQSRREFYQNQLINLLLTEPGRFTPEETKNILSSIYYSRISLLRIDKREKAKKNWLTYGEEQYVDQIERCEDYVKPGDKAWGPCFKLEKNKIYNKMQRRNRLSGKASVAFNYKFPSGTRNERVLILVVKLGSKLVPAPGIVKKAFRTWLNSFYKEQRKAEGYLYGAFVQQNDANMANWVLIGTANPLIRR